MNNKREELPLDARLLSDAIIEINISRRNVAIYPKGHYIVEKSLNRAFNYLKKLFEIRAEITLKVAKDTLIIDDYYLDKKNSVYKEFALSLSRMDIAYVTFKSKISNEEIYNFQKLLFQYVKRLPSEKVQEEYKKYNFSNIDIAFVDYKKFSFDEGKRLGIPPREHLWERYVQGLVEGTLSTEEQSQMVAEVPPEILAELINDNDIGNPKQESYEKIVVNYLKQSSERLFSNQDIKKLTKFINSLRPELKKQFLSSSVRTFSKDINSAEKFLRGVSVENVMELLNTINEQKVTIPDSVNNLLQKLSKLELAGGSTISYGDKFAIDDIPLSKEIMQKLSEDKFKHFVNENYSDELKSLLQFDIPRISTNDVKEFINECGEEKIDLDFNKIILEFITFNEKNLLTREDYEYYDLLLQDQIEYFIGTGQYEQVMAIFKSIKLNAFENRFPKATFHMKSPAVTNQLVDSFRNVGRQKREEAISLSKYYGKEIILPLIEALIEEQSVFIRKFLLDMIMHQGEKAVPEAIKHLHDSRWYVQRNMLVILSKYTCKEAIPYIRKLCYHNHPKVSYQAMKCLLQNEDIEGLKALKHNLGSKDEDKVKKAIVLSGIYRVKDVVPVLIELLKKKVKTKSDFNCKILIVKTLGQIGDVRALDVFKSILSSKSLFFQKSFTKLKREISKTIKNYFDMDVQEEF